VLDVGVGGSGGEICTAALVVNLAKKKSEYIRHSASPARKLVYAVLLWSAADHC